MLKKYYEIILYISNSEYKGCYQRSSKSLTNERIYSYLLKILRKPKLIETDCEINDVMYNDMYNDM